MPDTSDSLNFIQTIVTIGSVIGAGIAALFAKTYKAGRKEAEHDDQSKEFDNMIANVVKNQAATSCDIKKLCDVVHTMDLRLTKLETQVSERDRYTRGRDPGGYGRFRDSQEIDSNYKYREDNSEYR